MIRTIAILVLLAATAANAQLTTTVKRIRLEHATAAELAGTTLDLGHAVFNEENPADLRIGDGETPGGIRVGSDWWTNNMLTAWGGLSRVDIEALLALSIGAYQERDTAALAALDAQVWRLDGRIDNLSADGLGAITAEADPIFAASAAYGITLGNLAAWNAAHGWGDHAQAGYLTEEADPAWAAAAPKYARLRDVEALVALSIPYVDLTPYALSADLLDYARLSDYAAATNAIWGSLASKAAASNLVAEASRLDGRVNGISAASLGALTVESDPEWSAASPDVARLRDVEALLAFSLGYPQEQDSAALSAVAAVSGRVDTVEGWGDHAAAGYLTSFTETDPVFAASVAYGINSEAIGEWGAAYAWGDHAEAGYLTAESDPEFTAWLLTDPLGDMLTSYEETDPLFAASPAAAITTDDLSAWEAAYGWGDHAEAGYLTEEADAAALSAVAAVSGRVDTVEGWGDHSAAGYLTAEADAVALSAVAAVSVRVDTVEGWGDHAEAGYLTEEADAAALSAVAGVESNLTAHAADTENPHGVTAGQIGALTEEEDAAALSVIGSATNALLDLAGTRAMTGDGVTLARDVKSRDAASVGNYGAAFGYSTTAGAAGAAFGYNTSAGDYGFAAGLGTSADFAGFAAGESTSADFAGFAAGYNTSAGYYGFAAGKGTSAGSYGFAAGYNTSAGDFGFAAGRAAKGALGSFVFADNSTGGTPFNRTNRPNEFSARAAGGVYFDTPMMAVTGTVSAGSITLGTNAPITDWPQGTILGATINGPHTVATNDGILEFTVASGGTGWTNLAFSGTGNALTGATATATTLTLQRGTIEGGGSADFTPVWDAFTALSNEVAAITNMTLDPTNFTINLEGYVTTDEFWMVTGALSNSVPHTAAAVYSLYSTSLLSRITALESFIATNGNVTNDVFSPNPAFPGAIRCVFSPSHTYLSGARWSLDYGVNWRTNGAVVTNLSQGTYPLLITNGEWRFKSPTTATVNAYGALTNTVTLTFAPQGKVSFGGPGSITWGGGEYACSAGQSVTSPVGPQTFIYSDETAYVTPDPLAANVIFGSTLAVPSNRTSWGRVSFVMTNYDYSDWPGAPYNRSPVVKDSDGNVVTAKWGTVNHDFNESYNAYWPNVSIGGAPITYCYLPAGTHTFHFASAIGYLPPSPWTVAITNGQTTNKTAVWSAGSWLRVTSNVSGVSFDIGGTPYSLSGYSTLFGPFSNYASYVITPASAGASYITPEPFSHSTGYGGSTATVGIVYSTIEGSAKATISIEPSAAAAVVTNFQCRGLNYPANTPVALGVGTSVVSVANQYLYSPSFWYWYGASSSVVCSASSTSLVTLTMTKAAKLQFINDSGYSASYAVDGGAWKTDAQYLYPGEYEITFSTTKPDYFVTPAATNITVTNGQSLTLRPTWEKKPAALTVNLDSAAASNGAMWSIDAGANWNLSGATVSNLAWGSTQTVTFADCLNTNYYVTPADKTVILYDWDNVRAYSYSQMGYLKITHTAPTMLPEVVRVTLDGGETWLTNDVTLHLPAGNVSYITGYESTRSYAPPGGKQVYVAGAQTTDVNIEWKMYGGLQLTCANPHGNLGSGVYPEGLAWVSYTHTDEGWFPPQTNGFVISPGITNTYSVSYVQAARLSVIANPWPNADIKIAKEWCDLYVGSYALNGVGNQPFSFGYWLAPDGRKLLHREEYRYILPGSYTCSFPVVYGWEKPADIVFEAQEGETLDLTGAIHTMKDTAHIIMVGALLALVGCSTVKDKAKDWLEQQLGNEPTQPTPEQPPAQEPAVADAVAFDKLVWSRGGENFSKAVRDPACAITGVKIRGGGTPVLSYGGEGFQKWPVKDENVTHIWAIFFDSDGDGVFERGGKFDWGRSTAADRPLAHLTHYKGWDGYPRKGTPWAAVITDVKGKRRSNVVKGVWP